MSIKITKSGVLPRYKGQCSNCNCEFEFDYSDGRYDITRGLLVNCPVCKWEMSERVGEIDKL